MADIFFPVVGLPDWSVTAVLVMAAIGFPLALVLSWLFELTLIILLCGLVGYLYVGRLSEYGAGTAPTEVEPRTSSFQFKNRDIDIPSLGARLGVAHVLEGSVRFQGQRRRVAPLAYDYYMRARAYMRLPMAEQNVLYAIELYDKANARQAQFADAYAGFSRRTAAVDANLKGLRNLPRFEAIIAQSE